MSVPGRFLAFVLSPLAVVAAVSVLGCSSEPDVAAAVAKHNNTNLKKVANLYRAYQQSNGWAGPKDIDSFKKFVVQIPANRLEMMSIDASNLDAIFICERDQKPIKIRFGVQGGAMAPPNPVAFEEVGVDGKRLVAFTDSSVVEADDSRYNELWEGKAGPPTEAASPPSG